MNSANASLFLAVRVAGRDCVLRVRAAPRGRLQHRRADAEAGGRLRRQPPHHHGHRRRLPRPEHAQVSTW